MILIFLFILGSVEIVLLLLQIEAEIQNLLQRNSEVRITIIDKARDIILMGSKRFLRKNRSTTSIN